MSKTILVTGGAGFIGSALVRQLAGEHARDVVVVDKLTYAANLASLAPVSQLPNYRFYKADICNLGAMQDIIEAEQPSAIIHLAAESHVDRSITGAAAFVQTNVVGTSTLLEAARGYWNGLCSSQQELFRFLHISTDEVYGSLAPREFVTEKSPYNPSSPYAASKAASDHLVAAWHETYALPTLITNCTNNFGPYHFPEKLIPLIILNALEGKPLPVYGDGRHERDWLFVGDHVRALLHVLEKGRVGETYLIGGGAPLRNIDVVERICDLLDELRPNQTPRRQLITFVADRPGHDRRYAIDPTKIERELGWRAKETFASGIDKTVRWYLDNEHWWRPLREKVYAGQRLGLIEKKESDYSVMPVNRGRSASTDQAVF